MIEALLVLAAVVVASAAAWLLPLLAPESLVTGGWIVTAIGLVLGLPAGAAYHAVLRACLRANGTLPARWWVHPVALHDGLDARQRVRVMRWFLLGGAGFAASLVGCAVVAAGVVLQGVRAGVL